MEDTEARSVLLLKKPAARSVKQKSNAYDDDTLRVLRLMIPDDRRWLECVAIHLANSSLTTPAARRCLALSRADQNLGVAGSSDRSATETPESLEAAAIVNRFDVQVRQQLVDAVRRLSSVVTNAEGSTVEHKFVQHERGLLATWVVQKTEEKPRAAKVIPLFPSGGRV